MSLTEDDVRKAARLARLELDPGETARCREQLERILEHVSTMATPELASVAQDPRTAGLLPPLRADEARDSGFAERLLTGAPEREGPYFKVPKVLDGE